jgi:hypothetical protein
MEMQELEIIIGKDGKVQVAARGMKGEGCRALTKNIEDALGTVEEREYTAEYYEPPAEIPAYQQNGRT